MLGREKTSGHKYLKMNVLTLNEKTGLEKRLKNKKYKLFPMVKMMQQRCNKHGLCTYSTIFIVASNRTHMLNKIMYLKPSLYWLELPDHSSMLTLLIHYIQSLHLDIYSTVWVINVSTIHVHRLL